MKRKSIGVVSVIMVICVLFACLAPSALAAPRASEYISLYSASAAGGGGNVTVYFNITGTGIMTDIGATKVVIKDSAGRSVYYFYSSSYPSMLGHNRSYYSSSVTYSGVPGTRYSAVVFFYAANSSGSDTATYTTATVTA